jgi:hypothetical protein
MSGERGGGSLTEGANDLGATRAGGREGRPMQKLSAYYKGGMGGARLMGGRGGVQLGGGCRSQC